MSYQGLDISDPSTYYMNYHQFIKMINKHSKEFIDYLLDDTIAWATANNYEFHSPKFLDCRLDEVKKQYHKEQSAITNEQKGTPNEKIVPNEIFSAQIQTAFSLNNQKVSLDDDLSQFM